MLSRARPAKASAGGGGGGGGGGERGSIRLYALGKKNRKENFAAREKTPPLAKHLLFMDKFR